MILYNFCLKEYRNYSPLLRKSLCRDNPWKIFYGFSLEGDKKCPLSSAGCLMESGRKEDNYG